MGKHKLRLKIPDEIFDPMMLTDPKLGPELEKKVEEMYEKKKIKPIKYCTVLTPYSSYTKAITHILNCCSCLKQYEDYICRNPNISGETLMEMRRATLSKYQNPNIWDALNANPNIIYRRNGLECNALCSNPRPEIIAEIEKRPEQIRSYCLPALFDNPSAVNLIIRQKFDGEKMVKYGTKHPHFYPYFDLELCKKILCDPKHTDLRIFFDLCANEAARDLIAQNFEAIILCYPHYYGIVAQYKHHWNLVQQNISDFIDMPALGYLNLNPYAVEFLRNRPYLIKWKWIVENAEAYSLVSDYFQHTENPEKIVIDAVNRPSSLFELVCEPED